MIGHTGKRLQRCRGSGSGPESPIFYYFPNPMFWLRLAPNTVRLQ